MKILLNILFMTGLTFSAMYDPQTTQTSGYDYWGELFYGLKLLLVLTPLGWGLMVALTIGLIMWFINTAKNMATADYSALSENEKQETLYTECLKFDKRAKAELFEDDMDEGEDETEYH